MVREGGCMYPFIYRDLLVAVIIVLLAALLLARVAHAATVTYRGEIWGGDVFIANETGVYKNSSGLIFYDDFAGTDLDTTKWDVDGRWGFDGIVGYYSVADSLLNCTGDGATWKTLVWDVANISSTETVVVEARVMVGDALIPWHALYFTEATEDGATGRFGVQVNVETGYWRVQYAYGGTYYYSSDLMPVNPNTWYHLRVWRKAPDTFEAFIYEEGSGSKATFSYTEASWAQLTWSLNQWIKATAWKVWDWFAVYKSTNITVYCPAGSAVYLYGADGSLLASAVDSDCDGVVTFDVSSYPMPINGSLVVVIPSAETWVWQGILEPNDAFIYNASGPLFVKNYASDGYVHFVNFTNWRLLVYKDFILIANDTIDTADKRIATEAVRALVAFDNSTKTISCIFTSYEVVNMPPSNLTTWTPSIQVERIPLPSLNETPSLPPAIANYTQHIGVGILLGIALIATEATVPPLALVVVGGAFALRAIGWLQIPDSWLALMVLIAGLIWVIERKRH